MTWEEAVTWLREQPDQQDLVKACFYDDPLQMAAKRFYDSPEWAAVCAELPARRGRALDIGAGRGISSYALAKDGWNVTALEPDSSAIVGSGAIRSLSDAENLNIKIVETFGETLPFEDGQFDLVYCRATLHHARDLAQLCREAFRVLAPGGIFLATREHVLTKHDDKPVFLAKHPLHKLYGGENAYLLAEYTAALEGAGFRMRKVFNPWESDINLYPSDKRQLRRALAKRIFLPEAAVPELVINFLGAMRNEPGRLYSFVAEKAASC